MALKTNYILTAQGSVIHPKLDILVPGTKLAHVKDYAATMVATLHKAGYYMFTLWGDENGDHTVMAARFTAETPDPVVTVK